MAGFRSAAALVTRLLVPNLAKADVVLDWNRVAVETPMAHAQSPFAQARYMSIVQLAVFEAVNAITHEYEPYLGTVVAPEGASAEAAAIEAAYRVLFNYFPANATSVPRIPRHWPRSPTARPRQTASLLVPMRRHA